MKESTDFTVQNVLKRNKRLSANVNLMYQIGLIGDLVELLEIRELNSRLNERLIR